MKAYIPHYTPLAERKTHILNECMSAGIEPHLIEPFDREALTDLEIRSFHPSLSLAKISLILKHVEAWRQLAASSDTYALILEDDAFLCPEFLPTFTNYMHQVPESFDLLMLNEGCGLQIPEARLEEGNNIYKRGTEPTEWGGDGGTRCTDGYVISKPCATKFVEMFDSVEEASIKKPLDFWMNDLLRQINAEVYWAEPSLVRQGSLFGVFQRSL